MKSFRAGIKLKFQCPCGKRVVVDAQQKGSGNCPRCKSPLTVPSEGASESLSILCSCGAVLSNTQENCSICQKPLYEALNTPISSISTNAPSVEKSSVPPGMTSIPNAPALPSVAPKIEALLAAGILLLGIALSFSLLRSPPPALENTASDAPSSVEKKKTKPPEEALETETDGLTYTREMGLGISETSTDDPTLMATNEIVEPVENQELTENIPVGPVILEAEDPPSMPEPPKKQEIQIETPPIPEKQVLEPKTPETKEVPETKKETNEESLEPKKVPEIPSPKNPEKPEKTEQPALPDPTPEIERLLRALKSTSAEQVLNSLDQLAQIAKNPSRRLEAASALPEILPFLRANVWQVRSATAYALGQMERFEAVLPLIERLKKEKGRPCIEIREALTQITHLDFGADPKRWENFWKTQQDRFVRPKMSPPEANGSFYGVPILSTRLVFVVDTSGSMAAPAEYRGESSETVTANQFQPSTRLDVAKKELVKQIKGFNEKIRFNIIFFDNDLQILSKTLLPANSRNKAVALSFIEKQKPDGGTNIHDSLMKGLEIHEADTIIFLTDGTPTDGAITNPSDILIAIHQVNQFKRMKIYVIGIQAIGAENFLEQLSRQNFGTYTSK